MADEALQEEGLVAEALDCTEEAVFEPAEPRDAGVAELDALEVAPDALVGVEVGRVGGQPLQPQARRGAGGE